MGKESAPLMPSAASAGNGESSSSKYYFVNKKLEGAPNLDQGSSHVEDTPRSGANNNAEEFAPRVLGQPGSRPPPARRGSMGSTASGSFASRGSLWSRMFSRRNASGERKYGEVGSLVKPRKAPVKVEPKVFFANERTFLSWLNLSVILAGASLAILSFSDDEKNPNSQIYGILILPVAVAFICYSMHQYATRAYMIRNRLPGPYEDTVGPTILAGMLMLSIILQFSLKIYQINNKS